LFRHCFQRLLYLAEFDCPGNGPVKALFNIFKPLRDDTNILEFARGLAKEHCLPLVRFNQRDCALRAKDGNRNSRETGTGTYVDDVQMADWKIHTQEERFAIMPFDDLIDLAHRGQIENSVPPAEQFEVPL